MRVAIQILNPGYPHFAWLPGAARHGTAPPRIHCAHMLRIECPERTRMCAAYERTESVLGASEAAAQRRADVESLRRRFVYIRSQWNTWVSDRDEIHGFSTQR